MKKKQITSKEEKRQFWQGHIEVWQQSGLSQAAYCRRNSLPVKSFGYWKRRNSRSSKRQLNFFPLVLSNSVVTPSHASLQLTLQEKRFAIEIREDFSPSSLKKLILSLEEL